MLDENKPPSGGLEPWLASLVRVGASALGPFSVAGAEIILKILRPVLEGRRDEWLEDLNYAMKRLEEHKLDAEKLSENPAFVDAVLSATVASMRTSQTEKRKALRNALINSALPEAPSLSMQKVMFDLIDRFTEWHLRILLLIAGALQDSHPGEYLLPLNQLLPKHFPALLKEPDLPLQVVLSLQREALIKCPPRSPSIYDIPIPGHIQVTDFGKRFIAFISEP